MTSFFLGFFNLSSADIFVRNMSVKESQSSLMVISAQYPPTKETPIRAAALRNIFSVSVSCILACLRLEISDETAAAADVINNVVSSCLFKK
jgi:hypothetical protein